MTKAAVVLSELGVRLEGRERGERRRRTGEGEMGERKARVKGLKFPIDVLEA